MAYIAVNIYSGAENSVVEHITKACEKQSFDLITSVIAPMVKVKKFNGEKKCAYRAKSILPYIFVKINSKSDEISAKIYHFLKGIPGIIKVLQPTVPEEEVESFCATLGSSIEESEFEFEMTYNQEEIKNQEVDSLTTLNDINSTNEEKQAAEATLKNIANHPVEVAQTLIKEGKASNLSLFNKIKVKQSKNKTMFKFPLVILAKTIQRIDPTRKISNETMTNPEFLLPHLNETMRRDLAGWKHTLGK